jgi:hypothetical protein
MSSLAKKIEVDFFATEIWFDEESLCMRLSDGRELKVPLEFYPRLKQASRKQRENFQLIGLGTGIHWPDIDEDLSVEGIVLGIPARF